MRVWAVVPTLNRPADLDRCLEAVSRQTCPPAQILVVDGDPDAGARGTVERWRNRLPVLWMAGSQHGLPAQRNRAIELLPADAEAVLFLDDDVVLAPDYLERLVAALEDGGSGVAGASGVSGDPKQPQVGLLYRGWRWLFVRGVFGRPGFVTKGGVNLAVEPDSEGPVRVGWLNGCALYRRNVFTEHAFDESLSGAALMEDVEFSHRVGRRWRLVVEPSARLLHNHSPAGRASAGAHALAFVRNRYWFLRKNDWSPATAAAFWWTTLGYLGFWAAQAARGRPHGVASLAGGLAGVRCILRGDLPELVRRDG